MARADERANDGKRYATRLRPFASHNSALFAGRKKHRWHPTAKTVDRFGSVRRPTINIRGDGERSDNTCPGSGWPRGWRSAALGSVVDGGDNQQQLAGSAPPPITADFARRKH